MGRMAYWSQWRLFWTRVWFWIWVLLDVTRAIWLLHKMIRLIGGWRDHGQHTDIRVALKPDAARYKDLDPQRIALGSILCIA